MDILDDMGVSKLSAKVFPIVNCYQTVKRVFDQYNKNVYKEIAYPTFTVLMLLEQQNLQIFFYLTLFD